MSYSESEKYTRIRQLIYRYLCDYNLPKIACLSTCAPNKNDKDYLVEYFNYICFCTSSIVQLTQFLLKRYLLRFGKTPFDVVIDTPFSCLQSRRYGYVCIEANDEEFAAELLLNVSHNKGKFSKEYPILIRIKGIKFQEHPELPHNCLYIDKLDETDIVFKII